MATLQELERQGALFRLDAGLPPAAQEERLIFISPRLQAWLENVLPTMTSNLGIQLSPAEQLGSLVEKFCSGARLHYPSGFNPLGSSGDGLWKLKTPDLRVFGWFARIDCFVGVCANDATQVKDRRLYNGHAGEVRYFRQQLDLDEPKFVEGDDPNGVVSNFTSS